MSDANAASNSAISGFGTQREFALRDAARAGDALTVGLLLRHGADPRVEIESRSPLVHAVAAQSVECVKLLIPVSDVGAQKNLALHTATQNQNLEIGRLLLPHCDVFERTKAWPNAMLAAHGEMASDEWIAELVKRAGTTPEGERPNNFDKTMSKMFFLSARSGAWRSIEAILPYVDANALDDNGESALRTVLSVPFGSVFECVAPLLSGADLLAADKQGRNPLMLAAQAGRTDSVEQILSHAKAHGQEPGATAVDEDGETALMSAAEGGEPGSVKALLPWSDPTRKTPYGDTAFDLAVRASRWECADELAEHATPAFLDRALMVCPTPGVMPRARALHDARAIQGELAAVAAVQAQEDAAEPQNIEARAAQTPSASRRGPRSL